MIESLYLKRYGYPETLITQPPNDDLSLCIVIPCYNETTLIKSLQSIHECHETESSIEVIVIVNDSTKDPDKVLEQNKNTFKEAGLWAENHNTASKKYFIHWVSNLSPKDAGVGYARKIGMDEAVRRFQNSGNDGLIVCFDADSICSKNYLHVLEHYANSTSTNGCSINFEHPLEGYDQEIISGIINYELHLRYYINALRFSNYPYAHHTIGSSMAVRSSIYEKSGGMNKRKAGEDFYFLYKIIPYGDYEDVYDCTVYPSPRVSTRVPFGTGRFMSGWVAGETLEKSKSYHPSTFEELKRFIALLPELYNSSNIGLLLNELPEAIKSFMTKSGLEKTFEEIRKNTKSYEAFEKRFFNWFDGLKVLKFVHYSRDSHYPNQPLKSCCEWLFENYFKHSKQSLELKEWLIQIRVLDKKYLNKLQN